MLDFYLIRDDQPTNSKVQLKLIGGIEWEEFDEAQVANVIETHFDFYDKFRWSKGQIKSKIVLLESLRRPSLANLTDILKQGNAVDCRLVAYGD